MKIFESNRHFKLWEYRGGAASLIIRSPKDGEYTENIDITCHGVTFLTLSAVFNGMDVYFDSIETINKREFPDHLGRCFLKIKPKDANIDNIIVCKKFYIEKNTLELFQTSIRPLRIKNAF